MRAEFYVPDAPDRVVGRGRWGAQGVELEADDADARAKLERIFRPTAVVVDDPALRSFGTAGPTVLQPGSLRWFHEAALTRAKEDGLAARLVPETVAVDYDPAGLYRTFDKQWERRETGTRSRLS